MADLADLTSANDFTEEILTRYKNSAAPKAVLRGRCLNCGASVPDLYCDDDCRSDYEHQQRVTNLTKRPK